MPTLQIIRRRVRNTRQYCTPGCKKLLNVAVCTVFLFTFAKYVVERKLNRFFPSQDFVNVQEKHSHIIVETSRIFDLNTDKSSVTNPTTTDDRNSEIENETKKEKSIFPTPTEKCEQISPKLVGVLNSDPTITPTMDEVIKKVGPDLRNGGCYSPPNCIALQKVAVIIPFKDREAHLKTLLYYLHPMLMRQQLHYCVYVTEQFDNGQFNKATIMNAAFEEVLKLDNYSCIILHDVDMIPENDNNLYMCGDQPKHLSPAIDKFGYKPHYGTCFGGVTAITVEQYRRANGHSNRFWGWGGEDNDMEYRIQRVNMTIVATEMKIGRYKMIPHLHQWKFAESKYPALLNKTRKERATTDGLVDLDYRLKEIIRHPMYTKFMIDVRKVVVTKLTLYVDEQFAMDIDLKPEPCRYDEFPGKYLDNVIELTDKNVAQNLNVWPVVDPESGISSKLKDNLRRSDGKTQRFSLLRDLKQAQDLCNKLVPACAGIVEMQAASQKYYSLRMGYLPRHLIVKSYEGESERSKSNLGGRNSYLRYCPGEYSYFKPYRNVFKCDVDKECPHTYSFKVHFELLMKTTKYLYYTDEKSLEARRDNGESHYSFLWPDGKTPDITKENTVKKYSFRTPNFSIPQVPGIYAVESSIRDNIHQPYFAWNWLFEVSSGDLLLDRKTRHAYRTIKFMKRITPGDRTTLYDSRIMEFVARGRDNPEKLEEERKKFIENPHSMPPKIAAMIEKYQNQQFNGKYMQDPFEELINPYSPKVQKKLSEMSADEVSDFKKG